MLKKFNTLIELLTYFKGEQTCRDYLEQIRWNGANRCAYAECNNDKVFKFKNGKVFKCAKCKRQYSVRVGTIFEDSKIPLQKWFAAIYLITSHKKGISSLQLHRDIGVTQKSAWYLLHRCRHSLGLNVGIDKLTGIIEGDETFIGGNEKNKHAKKKTEDNHHNHMTLVEVIDRWKVNRVLLASKLNMPVGTFNNKLSDKHPTQFRPQERNALIQVLRDMQNDLNEVTDIEFNDALATIVK